MAIRRGRVPAPSYLSTKGHSVLKQRSYAMPSRTPSYVPRATPSVAYYDPRVDDYLLSDRVSNVSYLSSATLDDSDDTVRRSRGRDQQLLRDATNAIVSSESYATPQTSVASRRVARGRSLAPRAASVPPRPLVLNPPEAAIIASKLEPDPLKRRRPRSEFAANKYRAMRKEAQSPPAGPTTKVFSKVVVRRPGSASEQVVSLPYPTVKRKSRFLSRAAPVKYFPSPYDFPDPRLNVPKKSEVRVTPVPKPKDKDSDRIGGGADNRRATVKIPSYYASGVDPSNPPMSDLRRRIRKTLNKTRHSSVY